MMWIIKELQWGSKNGGCQLGSHTKGRRMIKKDWWWESEGKDSWIKILLEQGKVDKLQNNQKRIAKIRGVIPFKNKNKKDTRIYFC